MDRYDTHEVVNQLLKSIGAGAVITAGLIAPNSLQIVDKYLSKSNKPKLKFEHRRLLRHMKRLNLLNIQDLENGKQQVSLTKKGHSRLKTALLSEINVKPAKKWDGRWRIVTFDIKQDLRKERYEFLAQLRRMGFYLIQQNMWVYPFPCEGEVVELADMLEIKDNIMLIEAKLTTDKHLELIDHFSSTLKNSSLTINR